MDPLIAYATVLLILSLATERLANWIKLIYSEDYFGFRGFKLITFGQLREKTGDEREEKKREGRILKLNLGCGLFVAVVFMFYVHMNADLPADIEWLRNYWSLLLLPFIGLFLSFGSKFWHDTLDMLLEIKNLKGQLVKSEGTKARTLAEEEDQASITDVDIQAASDALSGKLTQEYPGVRNTVHGEPSLDNGVRRWKLIVDPGGAQIATEATITVKGRNVPIVIRSAGESDLHAGVCGGIRNKDNPAEVTGTLGCLVKDANQKSYLLSCYHVMRHDQPWSEFKSTGHEDIVEPDSLAPVGKLTRGCRTEFTDVAIAALEGARITSELLTHSAFSGYRDVTQFDVLHQTMIWLRGAKTNALLTAVIHNRNVPQWLPYSDDWFLMKGLIEITKERGPVHRAPTQKGDSGLVTYDVDGRAIGMLVGGNPQFSYLIPIARVLNPFDLELIKHGEA